MAYNSNYGDVQDELHRIRRTTKDNALIVWIFLPVTFVIHAAVLGLVVWGVSSIFGNVTVVIGVTCAAYVSAVIGWAVHQVKQRTDQAALHAISVHDEVLLVKELVLDEQRKRA